MDGTGGVLEMKRIFLVAGLLAAVSVLAFASGSKEGTTGSTAQNVTMNVWMNWNTQPELKMPKSQWYISEAFKRFEQQHPGVKIVMTVPADQGAAHQQFKAAALAGDAPDVANLWTGQPIFALSSVLLKLNGKIPEDLQKNLIGWEDVTLGFKKNGEIIGYPALLNQIQGFDYNKKLVRAAGLNWETNPPKDVAQFMTDLQKIKDTGVLPIADQEGAWAGMMTFCGAYWWDQTSGNTRIFQESMNMGPKYVNDKGLLNALTTIHEMYARGFVNKDAATTKTGSNLFLSGKAALFCQDIPTLKVAMQDLGENNVGFLEGPDYSANVPVKDVVYGGPGQSLVISRGTKHPQLAIDLLNFLSSKKETVIWDKLSGNLPIRKDVTAAEIGLTLPLYQRILDRATHGVLYWVDNTQQPEVMNLYYRLATLVLIGQMTPMEMAKQLDQKAASVAAENG